MCDVNVDVTVSCKADHMVIRTIVIMMAIIRVTTLEIIAMMLRMVTHIFMIVLIDCDYLGMIMAMAIMMRLIMVVIMVMAVVIIFPNIL